MSTFYYLRLVEITYFEKMLVGKLYKPMRAKHATLNTFLDFFCRTNSLKTLVIRFLLL